MGENLLFLNPSWVGQLYLDLCGVALSIPRGYRNKSGKQISVWLLRQRKAYLERKLSVEKTELLTGIGMVFELDDPWEVGFTHAKEYAITFGNLNVPGNYICTDGYNLGGWLMNQRNNHNNPTQYHYLTSEQSERLEKLGMVWNPTKEKWLEGFQHACEYAKLLNGGKWLTTYISPDGYQTGQWLRNQKRRSLKNQLDDDKSAMLAEIGFVFA